MSDDDPTAASRYEWERIVRRVGMPSTVKLVAFALATYADSNGCRVYPGVSRLVHVTSLSERSVRNALAELRRIGLIERTREGSRNGRRALTDEHRLAIPADLLDRAELLDPDESPAAGAGDRSGTPATDDTNTGTWCRNTGTSRPDHRQEVHPTTTRPTTYQHNYQRDDHSAYATTDRARDDGRKIIPLNVGGGRR